MIAGGVAWLHWGQARLETSVDEFHKKIAAIEKERDLAAGHVDDLIKLIQEGLREGASSAFQHAAEILQKEGTDEARLYLESRRQATLVDARRHAEPANVAQRRTESEKELRNKSLRSLILEVELLESKLQWEPAIKLREQIAELAPDWFEARAILGIKQIDLARFQDAEPHLRAALKLANTASDEANALANLTHLLHATNRLTEAEPMMRRAPIIDEEFYGGKHHFVAIRLGTLGPMPLRLGSKR